MKIMVLKEFTELVIEGCHEDLDHLSLERILDLLQDRFYWPGLGDEAERHIQMCKQCLWFKDRPQ